MLFPFRDPGVYFKKRNMKSAYRASAIAVAAAFAFAAGTVAARSPAASEASASDDANLKAAQKK